MTHYEELYSECPEENPLCDIDVDYLYDSLKDEAILCTSNATALRLHHTGFTRFLPEHFRYYLYTVECRKANQFPLGTQLWRQSNDSIKSTS